MSYKVYRCEREEEGPEDDYIGRWYKGQHQPQPIQLTLDGNNETVEIDYFAESGGQTIRNFLDRDLVFYLGVKLCHIDEAKGWIEEIKPITDKLFEYYEEFYDGGNYIGRWQEELVEELSEKLSEFETELFWNDEGFLDEEEDEEE